MRILHTVHAYPPSTGGSEEVVARLSEGLVARGHEVHVATAHDPAREPHPAVAVHGFRRGPLGAASYRRFVHEGDWDVILTYHSKVWTHLALWPFKDLPAPWVYCPVEYTDIGSRKARHRLYYRTIEPRSLRAAARVKVLTARDARRTLEMGDIGPEKLRIVPNGVDAAYWAVAPPDAVAVRARYGVPADVPLGVYAGGYWPHKDVETLVDAVARTPRSHLVCTGADHGSLRACRARARSRGVRDRVRFLGVVPREDLRDLYHAADVVVSASRKEGFGLVFLQGLACGTPVAARDVGAVPDLRGAGADIVVAGGAAEFGGVLEEPPARRAKGTTDVAREYDWTRVCAQLEAVYKEVVG